MATLIVLVVVALVVLITLSRGIRIVPQARAGIVERLGRYHRTLDPGLALIIPFGSVLFGLHLSDMGVIGVGSALAERAMSPVEGPSRVRRSKVVAESPALIEPNPFPQGYH